MKIATESREGHVVIHLTGEFDNLGCQPFLREIESLIAEGVTRVALNLRLVTFINSTALGAIISGSKSLDAQEGKLFITRPSRVCRSVFDKIGLNQLIPVHDTDEETGAALQALQPEDRDD